MCLFNVQKQPTSFQIHVIKGNAPQIEYENIHELTGRTMFTG